MTKYHGFTVVLGVPVGFGPPVDPRFQGLQGCLGSGQWARCYSPANACIGGSPWLVACIALWPLFHTRRILISESRVFLAARAPQNLEKRFRHPSVPCGGRVYTCLLPYYSRLVCDQVLLAVLLPRLQCPLHCDRRESIILFRLPSRPSLTLPHSFSLSSVSYVSSR